MKIGWAVAFGLVGGLLGAALIILMLRQPGGQPVKLNPPPTQEAVQVHVAGAVRNPGLYSIAYGSRVDDAIQAAGGLLPDASIEVLNLAAIAVDGERIYIPTQAQTGLAPSGFEGGHAPGTPAVQASQVTEKAQGILLININTATVQELESLPGIGPTLAGRVVEYRTTNGLFSSIEDITKVTGIGPTIYERIKNQITIGYNP